MAEIITVQIRLGTEREFNSRLARAADEANEGVRELITLLEGIQGGAINGKLIVRTENGDGVKPYATITCAFASAAGGNTLTCAGVDLTCTTSASAVTHFGIGTTSATLAENLADTINEALDGLVTATVAGRVVTVTSDLEGAEGLSKTVSTSNATAFTLAGGAIVGGKAFSGGTGVVDDTTRTWNKGVT